MKPFPPYLRVALSLLGLFFASRPAEGAGDLLGYSVLKGQYLNQTGAETVVTDPDFGFSLLASVDLVDFDLMTNGSVRLPNGSVHEMDNLGDAWAFLDIHPTLASLNAAAPWGNYRIRFKTFKDGEFNCLLPFDETSLPPIPRLANFDEVQVVDPRNPLTLAWTFAATPNPEDFVQLYITLGHGTVFATPDFGAPGALNRTNRFLTVPPGTLEPGWIYSLNMEITRVADTNHGCYPGVDGVSATFRSTSVDFLTITIPEVRLLSRHADGTIDLEVFGEPGKPIILQDSPNLNLWQNVATNAADSGINRFVIPPGPAPTRFFRALHEY